MGEYKINGKAIYTPKGAALEYGRVGCNFYTGCPAVRNGMVSLTNAQAPEKIETNVELDPDALTIPNLKRRGRRNYELPENRKKLQNVFG